MNSPATQQHQYPFLTGGGEMGELIRKFDWSQTSLGTPDTWPLSLRATLGIVLSSRFPMFLWWGADLIQFYNDAYRPSLGNDGKHPSALGQKGEDTWPEIWPVIKPMINDILQGGAATLNEDQLIPIYRNGKLEDAYWTFSYSPVRDDVGDIKGVLVMCTETTEQVQGLMKIGESKEQLEFAIEATELGTWDLNPLTGKFTANARLKDWFGLRPEEEIPLPRAIETIAAADRQRVADTISNSLQYESGGIYDIEYTIISSVGRERQVRAKGRAWFNENKIAYRFNGTLQDITVERKAQQEKVAAQALADLAIKSSGIGVFNIVIATGHMDYTPEFAAILTGNKDKKGLTREDFVKRIHADDEHLRVKAAKAVLVTGEFNYEPRVIWDDGSVHYLRIMGVGVRDNDNVKPTLFSGTVQDITEQRTVQEKLRESEQFSRTVFYHSPVAKLVYIGKDMILREANEKMLEIFGRDDSIIGKPILEAIPELRGTAVPERYQNVLTTGITHYEYAERIELIRHGQSYWGYYDYTYKPLLDTEGEIYGVICTAVEVTSQVEARQKLEAAEANMRGAVELAQLGTWSIEANNYHFTTSERLRSWFGYGLGEDIYTTGYNPVHEKDRDRVNAAIAEALRPGSDGTYDIEYTIVEYRTGRERIHHAIGKTVCNEEGAPIRLQGTAQDVTAQRQIQLALEYKVQERTEELAASNEELYTTNQELAELNEALIHSNEELGQYAYVASHDLQEPLRKIQLFADMLNSRSELPDQLREPATKIAASAHRMSLLIRDLLDFSRLLRSDSLFRSVDLSEVVAAIVGDFELVIKEKDARIIVGDLPVIQSISLQMNQLFYNLIGNALKFSKPEAAIKIEVSAEAITHEEVTKWITKPLDHIQYYHITVKDNGIGFETRYSEYIFEVFKRLHSRDMYPGSGIGLALCRRIVANHNGFLAAESEVGKGSIFHIYLPGSQEAG